MLAKQLKVLKKDIKLSCFDDREVNRALTEEKKARKMIVVDDLKKFYRDKNPRPFS